MKFIEYNRMTSRMGDLTPNRALVIKEEGIIKLSSHNAKGKKYGKIYTNLQNIIIEVSETKKDKTFRRDYYNGAFRTKESLKETGIYELEVLTKGDGITIYRIGKFIKEYQPRK